MTKISCLGRPCCGPDVLIKISCLGKPCNDGYALLPINGLNFHVGEGCVSIIMLRVGSHSLGSSCHLSSAEEVVSGKALQLFGCSEKTSYLGRPGNCSDVYDRVYLIYDRVSGKAMQLFVKS